MIEAGVRARLGVVCGFAWVLAALVCFSGVAQAAPRGRPEVSPGFKLEASNGYTVWVFGFDSPEPTADNPYRSGDQAFMVVEKPGSFAYYDTDTRSVSGHSITATFGSVAEIDVRFRATPGVRIEKRRCSDERVRLRSGFYEGRIELRGEGGFVRASASRARADAQFLLDAICTSGIGESTRKGARGAMLRASTIGEFPSEDPELSEGPQISPQVDFQVNRNRSGKRARIQAWVTEDVGDSMTVLRGVGRMLPNPSFSFDRPLTHARVAPPAPFAGSASFLAGAPPAGRWSGDLTVDLPGHSDVPLTGPDVRAQLRPAVFFREPSYPYD